MAGTGPAARAQTVRLTQLPGELLEKIFEFLTFRAVAQLRGACAVLRGAAERHLRRHFLRLKTRVEGRLRALEGERSEPEPRRDPLTLLRCAWILRTLRHHVQLLRAVALRYIASGRACFFGGRLLDELAAQLRLAARPRLLRHEVDLEPLALLVDAWVDFFHDRVEPQLLSERQALFGSKAVDLLECWADCERDVRACVDGRGWWRLRARYRLRRCFFVCLGGGGARPLSAQQQRSLHESLRLLGQRSSEYALAQRHIAGENALRACGGGESWSFSGTYEGLNQCEDTLFFYGHFSELGFRSKFAAQAGELPSLDRLHVTAELTAEGPQVELCCRPELAPVELWERWRQSREPGAEPTAAATPPGPVPDLRLALRISCPLAAAPDHRLPPVYHCLVEQSLDRAPGPAPARPFRAWHARNQCMTKLQPERSISRIMYVERRNAFKDPDPE